RLGELLAHVDPELLHGLHDGGIDLPCRSRAGRADLDPSVRAELDQAGSHLAAAGVVHTDEEDLGLHLAERTLGLGEWLGDRIERLVHARLLGYRQRSMSISGSMMTTISISVNMVSCRRSRRSPPPALPC